MQHFESRIDLLLLAFVVTIGLLAFAGCAQATGDLKPPVIVPISLDKGGLVLNKKISIAEHHVYYFSLRFSFKKNDQADRARVKSLVGGNETDHEGKPLQPGISTPVSLGVYEISAGEEIEVFTMQADPILTSWGEDNFTRQIGFIELKPGQYRVQLKLLRPAPEFEGTPVAVGIGYDKFKVKFNSNK